MTSHRGEQDLAHRAIIYRWRECFNSGLRSTNTGDEQAVHACALKEPLSCCTQMNVAPNIGGFLLQKLHRVRLQKKSVRFTRYRISTCKRRIMAGAVRSFPSDPSFF